MFESTTYAGTLAGQLRMRRLRRTGALRALVRETTLSVDNFIHPLFIAAGKNIERPIGSMAGHSQLSIDKLFVRHFRYLKQMGAGERAPFENYMHKPTPP